MEMDRRDFIRITGAVAAGGLLGAADAYAAEPAFREVARIPLKIDEPEALAVGEDGTIYAGGKNAVVAFVAGGRVAGVGGTPRDSRATGGQVVCMAAASKGRLLLGMRDCVEVMDAKGAVVAKWPWLGDRAYITCIAADDENVYVADAGNRVVLRFDHDGKLINKIGEKDKDRQIPGLVVPSPYFDVAVNAQGELWVVNPGRHGFENYRPNGDLVSSWYRAGMDDASFCGCCNPIHIAFRSNCAMATAEKGLNRIKLYAPDTTLSAVVCPPKDLTEADKQALNCNFAPPIKELAVDKQDRILILNAAESAIIIYDDKQG